MSENVDFISNPKKAFWQFTTPLLLLTLFEAAYSFVDVFWVSQMNAESFFAIGVAVPLVTLIISFGKSIGIGTNSLMSRKLGEKNFKMADDAATHGLLLCILSYAVFLLLGLFAVKPFMGAYTQDSAIYTYGVEYLTVVLCLSVFSIIEIMIEKTLQATGNMIFPMLFQLMGAVVNIIFDPLLIFGIGIFPEMGVTGAAVATVFGQFCGMVFSVIVLFCKKHEVKITFKNFRFNLTTVKNIYAVGFPSIIMQSISSIMIIGMNTIFTLANSIYSEACITVLGVYFKLQSFVFMPCFGLNQGVMPIIGYNYGARNRKRMYSALKRGIIIAVIIMAIGVVLMWTIPDTLISLFDGDESLMQIGATAFRIISLCFIPAALGILFTTLFQAVGKGIRSLIMSVCRQLLLILPIAYALSSIFGIESSWYAFPIAEIGSLILAICFFINLVKTDFKKLG